MMTKDERLALRLPTATKLALQKKAASERRSLSSLIEKILTEWLRHSKPGKLKPDGG